MVDLGVCVEGIRRAIVYAQDILEFREHPRKADTSRARIATEGFIEAIRAIAENCPLPEYKKKDFLMRYRTYKARNWREVPRLLSEAEIFGIPEEALSSLEDYLGFKHEKYEKYIPR